MTQKPPLSHQTMAKSVADVLREEIQRAELSPGTRLMQSQVAKRFGVSTTPVREAFTTLAGEGLVVIDQHRGAVVFRPTIEDFRECFQIRELLEGHAIAMAIPNLDEAAFSELQALIDEMAQTSDRGRWVDLNNRFHLTMYEAARQPRLLRLIAGLRDASVAYLHMFASARTKDTQSSEEEHRQILRACRERDVAAGVAAVRGHLWHAIEDVIVDEAGQADFTIVRTDHRDTSRAAAEEESSRATGTGGMTWDRRPVIERRPG